jgi:hypothetical protein
VPVPVALATAGWQRLIAAPTPPGLSAMALQSLARVAPPAPAADAVAVLIPPLRAGGAGPAGVGNRRPANECPSPYRCRRRRRSGCHLRACTLQAPTPAVAAITPRISCARRLAPGRQPGQYCQRLRYLWLAVPVPLAAAVTSLRELPTTLDAPVPLALATAVPRKILPSLPAPDAEETAGWRPSAVVATTFPDAAAVAGAVAVALALAAPVPEAAAVTGTSGGPLPSRRQRRRLALAPQQILLPTALRRRGGGRGRRYLPPR